ncbi:unnamed protein product [Trichobilharzia regenti]|nr:unnamed protein product [Trichobilharzia regenti]
MLLPVLIVMSASISVIINLHSILVSILVVNVL